MVEEIVPNFWKIFQDTLNSNSSEFMVGEGVSFFKTYPSFKFITFMCLRFDISLIFLYTLVKTCLSIMSTNPGFGAIKLRCLYVAVFSCLCDMIQRSIKILKTSNVNITVTSNKILAYYYCVMHIELLYYINYKLIS